MIRRPAAALLWLILVAGCHSGKVADVTLDADQAAENATAAKTLSDLAAADAAARAPLPPRHAAAHEARPASSQRSPAAAAPDADPHLSEDNASDGPAG